MNRVAKAYHLLAHLGPRWVWFRVRYAVRRKSGELVRGSRVRDWALVQNASATEPQRWFRPIDGVNAGARREADAVLRGEFRLFSRHMVAAGNPPAWVRNPLTGQEAPAIAHWSTLGDFAFGDIKGIWELSRFPWAFALGRAYSLTRDEVYADGFWRLFEHWLQHNRPNCGPNWMCGQEATFRLIAVLWASDVLHDSASTNVERLQRRDRFVAETARRIAANLDYALSQSNNHGVSECVGLITAALRLPNEPQAGLWAQRGWAELERQLKELVYPDGGFSQHSAIYHRVLLHDLLWLVSILGRCAKTVPDWLLGAAKRALEFIEALMTPENGRVPLYGPNDGANVLPLADADFLDFRPVVQAGYALLYNQRHLPPGPWDEAAFWLAPAGLPGEVSIPDTQKLEPEETERTKDGGRGADGGGGETESRKQRAESDKGTTNHGSRITNIGARTGARHFPDAGVLMWRQETTRIFFRCPTRFRHRPAQADMLHVDLEWRGVPIAHDAGTYSYNTRGPFAGGLKEAAVHNTVIFDGAEPLQKVSRFLYLPWPKGRAGWHDEEFTGAHDGWRRIGVGHERKVAFAGPETVQVSDRMSGRGRRRARVHWLLADLPHELRAEASQMVLRTDKGALRVSWVGPQGQVSLVRADPKSARGWWSPYYGHAAPALSLAIEFDFNGETEFVTRFEPTDQPTPSSAND